MKSRLTAAVLSAAVVVATAAAYAQQPATGDTVQSEADAAGQEPGGRRGFVDKARAWAEDIQLVERLSGDVDGWYPRLGGMTRGSGFAVGPGYRTHLFDTPIRMDLSAGLSTKMYKAMDANVQWMHAFDQRLELWTDFRYEDFPQEDFFGMGLDSSRTTRTSYDFDSSDVAARVVAKPHRWVRLGTSVGYMSPEIGRGTDSNYPSIEQIFTDGQAPGIAAQPNFLHTTFFAEIDSRDERGNPRSGGFYRSSFGIWDDQNLDAFDFRRFDLLLMQHVPLVEDKTHVLSGRIGTSYVNNEAGHRVPFYFLAYVGGVDTIRGFREFRFKDENALWMSAEYRWTPIKYASLVAFVDAGEVQADWQDIDLAGMRTGYGFGFRVHTRRQTFARLDFGTGGGEGWQMFIKLGPSF